MTTARTVDQPVGYVVALFGGGQDEWCTLPRCPLGSARWFRTRDEATAYANTVPAGFEPHTLIVENPPRVEPEGLRDRIKEYERIEAAGDALLSELDGVDGNPWDDPGACDAIDELSDAINRKPVPVDAAPES